ncbi:hypothetical protein CLAIMM_14599 [Cladophialophora immunda]|nr:hypothetical protein CLAIMM_14599 [Cladophialophora immunda]
MQPTVPIHARSQYGRPDSWTIPVDFDHLTFRRLLAVLIFSHIKPPHFLDAQWTPDYLRSTLGPANEKSREFDFLLIWIDQASKEDAHVSLRPPRLPHAQSLSDAIKKLICELVSDAQFEARERGATGVTEIYETLTRIGLPTPLEEVRDFRRRLLPVLRSNLVAEFKAPIHTSLDGMSNVCRKKADIDRIIGPPLLDEKFGVVLAYYCDDEGRAILRGLAETTDLDCLKSAAVKELRHYDSPTHVAALILVIFLTRRLGQPFQSPHPGMKVEADLMDKYIFGLKPLISRFDLKDFSTTLSTALEGLPEPPETFNEDLDNFLDVHFRSWGKQHEPKDHFLGNNLPSVDGQQGSKPDTPPPSNRRKGIRCPFRHVLGWVGHTARHVFR